MMARAGPGAAAYPRGIQTWNGTSPTLTAKPARSSTHAVARSGPAGTWVNPERASDPDLVTSRSNPARRQAPLIRPKARVISAAVCRPAGRRRNPTRTQNASVSDSHPNRKVNASRAVSTTATDPSASAYPAPRPRLPRPWAPGPAGPDAQDANTADTGAAAPNAMT